MDMTEYVDPNDPSGQAYYIRTANAAGEPADPKKWVLFMEGGSTAAHTRPIDTRLPSTP